VTGTFSEVGIRGEEVSVLLGQCPGETSNFLAEVAGQVV
jgi:hypothetical protein